MSLVTNPKKRCYNENNFNGKNEFLAYVFL